MIMVDKEMKMIDDQNFDYLQHIIKLIFCLYDKKENDEIEYNIDENNKRAKEIKEKILKGREKVARLKHKDEQSVFTIYMSMISVALGISLIDLSQYTMFQLFDTVERFSLYTNYDIDIKARMAGAKIDKPIENWTKNIHKYYV